VWNVRPVCPVYFRGQSRPFKITKVTSTINQLNQQLHETFRTATHSTKEKTTHEQHVGDTTTIEIEQYYVT
jgi:hypothetical protein